MALTIRTTNRIFNEMTEANQTVVSEMVKTSYPMTIIEISRSISIEGAKELGFATKKECVEFLHSYSAHGYDKFEKERNRKAHAEQMKAKRKAYGVRSNADVAYIDNYLSNMQKFIAENHTLNTPWSKWVDQDNKVTVGYGNEFNAEVVTSTVWHQKHSWKANQSNHIFTVPMGVTVATVKDSTDLYFIMDDPNIVYKVFNPHKKRFDVEFVQIPLSDLPDQEKLVLLSNNNN